MYLARKRINGRLHYSIRQSYPDGDVLTHRELFSLGTEPERYLVYPGGNSYYVDEIIPDQLRKMGVKPDLDLLEDIFWPFIHPEIRHAIEHFRNRHKCYRPRKKPTQEDFHLFDRRRIHFLRYGQIDQGRISQVSPRLFSRIAGKSRDELEQYFWKAESILKAHELKTYVYVIFDLQRFFTGLLPKRMPQGLDQNQVEARFLEEVCRLNDDAEFWAGMGRKWEKLHPYLSRYVIMFFDNPYGPDGFMQEEMYRFYQRKREVWHPPKGPKVGNDEIRRLFGVESDDLNRMNRRDLTRAFHQAAHRLHPDKQGGNHEQFIKLTAAFEQILRRKK